MPPPETKTISFAKPTNLKFHKSSNSNIVDLDKARIATQLRTILQDISGDDLIGMVVLPQFGYLYVAYNNQLLDYELNLLLDDNNKQRPVLFQIQISSNGSTVQIAPPKGIIGKQPVVLFDFSIATTTTTSDDDDHSNSNNNNKQQESIVQARKVAQEMEILLGYKIEEVMLS